MLVTREFREYEHPLYLWMYASTDKVSWTMGILMTSILRTCVYSMYIHVYIQHVFISFVCALQYHNFLL